MNKTDQRLYERTKDISYEDILYDCDNVSVNNNPFNADELMLKRMKARVMMQIKTTKTKRTLIKNLLAASFVLSFLAAALSPLGRNAFADILNKFYFIPGIGKAVLDDAEEVYILPKPILSKGDYGSINIHTITKTADTMIINVSSDVSLNNKSLLIEANKQ